MTSPPPLAWLQLTFPSQLEPGNVEAFFLTLYGLSAPGRRRPFVLEVHADASGIQHHLAVPETVLPAVLRWASVNVPGLLLDPVDAPERGPFKAARQLWMSTSRRPLDVGVPERVSAGLLAALHVHHDGDAVLLQWVLGPVRRSLVVPTNHPGLSRERWASAVLLAPFTGIRKPDGEAVRALRAKQGQTGGWRAVGRVAVRAATQSHAHHLLGSVLGAVRAAEGPGVQFGYRAEQPSRVTRRSVPYVWPLALSVPETVGLAAFPLSDLPGVDVARRRARLLPARLDAPAGQGGRVLALNPVSGRPLRISDRDVLSHMLLTAPTGAGKSVALTSYIAQSIAAGHSTIVVDPKSDTVRAAAGLIPQGREQDVVIMDAGSAPVGFNPLVGAAPELVADQVLAVIRSLSDSWGVRLNELLGATLTLLAVTGTPFAALPLVLQDDHLRRRLLGRLDDPLGVGPVFAAFERLSDEARAQAVAAVVNKVTPLTIRPQLRGVLGAARPKFSLAEAFTTPKIVLIDIPEGSVGPDAARLYGTLLVNTIANLTLARAAVPPSARRPVHVFIDELPSFVNGLTGDLGNMLAVSRGLGVSFTLATQALHMLPPRLQRDVLVNARNKAVWQVEADDAHTFARGQRVLTADDFAQLPKWEVYLRASVDSEVTPWMSGRMAPPPEPISDPDVIKQLSRERYGVPRAETDTALRALVEPPGSGSGPVGSRRRPS